MGGRKSRGVYRHDTLRPPIFPTFAGGVREILWVYRHDALRLRKMPKSMLKSDFSPPIRDVSTDVGAPHGAL